MELWAHPRLWGCHSKTGGRWEPSDGLRETLRVDLLPGQSRCQEGGQIRHGHHSLRLHTKGGNLKRAKKSI